MLNELIEQLKDDKYKTISSELEFLIECGCESQDHADIVKNAIEYIDLLENYIQGILVKVENIEKEVANMK